MSWINSSTTDQKVYPKKISQDIISFYHGFSKTPVEPDTTTGAAKTSLANASTKSGHTVIGTEVWAEEIPWFGLVASKDSGVSRLSGRTKPNDLVKVVDQNNQVYKYIGEENATFTTSNWDTFWTPITLNNGDEIVNAAGRPVLRYYKEQPMQVLTTDNNAGITSNGFATRLFVDETTHLGQTSAGSVVAQFAAGTDNIKNGIPSAELNPKLYLGTTDQIAGTHYYDYNVSGTILWNKNVASSSPKISCFRYIGKSVTAKTSEIESTITTHSNEISEIKDKLGLGDTGTEGTPTLGGRVTANETALRVLLGLDSTAEVKATESISASISAAEGRVQVTTDALAGRIAQLEGIQHFSVEIVPEGQTIENVNPLVENTIYLVKDTNAAEGTYIEYIAYKPKGSESVVTEQIGSTAIDLSGYTTDAEYEALAGETGRVTVVEGKVSTLEGQVAVITSTDATKEGSIAKALADAKEYTDAAKQAAIDSAKVTLTAGTGITIPNSGTPQTAFNVSVDTSVIATKQSVDDLSAIVSGVSQTVISNKTEVDAKISAIEGQLGAAGTTGQAIQAAQDAADAAQDTADEAKGIAETAVQSVSKAPDSSSLLSVTQTGTTVTVGLSSTVATKSDITAEINKLSDADGAITALDDRVDAIETSLAAGGTTAEAIAAAKKAGTDAQTAADAKVADVTVNGTSIVAGNAGSKTVALTTTKTDAITASADSASTKLATEASVAKALASITSVGVSYQVLTEGQSHTSVTAPVNGRIYLEKDITNAEAGVYIEWMYTNESGWEKIGSTKTDHSTYAAKITINGSEKSVANSAIDLGAFASSVTTGNGVASGSVSSTGALSLTLTTASTATAGITKLDNTITGSTSTTTAATPKAVKEYADTKVGSVQYFGENDFISSKAEITNGKLVISENEIINPNRFSGTAWNSSITKVVRNEAFVGSTKYATIETNKIKNGMCMFYSSSLSEFESDLPALTDADSMFSMCNSLTSFSCDLSSLTNGNAMFAESTALTSFTGDLSSLTNGNGMFQGCTSLTSFCGDLSSLSNGVDMFTSCQLDYESIECILDSLPTVTSGIIEMSIAPLANAIVNDLKAAFAAKGWNATITQRIAGND